MYKVIVSQKKVDSESLKRDVFLNESQAVSCWYQLETLEYCCPLVGLFALVWMKMQIHSLPLGAAFGAGKIAVSPVTLYTKQHCTHKHCFLLWNEIKSTNHRRLESRQGGGVWKNESLSESFGSRWASKVKINAYYKIMKVFYVLFACMSTCCWGLPKPKYEPFITHNRGNLTWKTLIWWQYNVKHIVANR